MSNVNAIFQKDIGKSTIIRNGFFGLKWKFDVQSTLGLVDTDLVETFSLVDNFWVTNFFM